MMTNIVLIRRELALNKNLSLQIFRQNLFKPNSGKKLLVRKK